MLPFPRKSHCGTMSPQRPETGRSLILPKPLSDNNLRSPTYPLRSPPRSNSLRQKKAIFEHKSHSARPDIVRFPLTGGVRDSLFGPANH